MADQIIKAEPKHYKAWLRQSESPLIDSLLMINGFYCKKPNTASSVTYLYQIMDSQMDKAKNFMIPKSESHVYSRTEKVLKLITHDRMVTIKKSNLFRPEEERPDYLIQWSVRDPDLFLNTSIIPKYFVNRLVEYKVLLPELLKEFDMMIRDPASYQAPLIDSRELKSERKMFYYVVDTHYDYDPRASKNSATAIIATGMQNKGLSISVATVKRILNRIYQIGEEELNPKNKSL